MKKMGFFVMYFLIFLSIILLMGCLLILFVNSFINFPISTILNFAVVLYLRLTTSFMAAGGLILFTKCVTKTPFLRTSGDDVPSDLADTICSKNSSNSSLPTAWFEEVNNEILLKNFERFDSYCMLVSYYAICLVIEKIWTVAYGRPVRELIPLATSIILPNDNKEERKRVTVQHMISKTRAHESYFRNFFYAEFLFCLIGIICFILNLVTSPSLEHFAVHLNGSEWTVDCDRQATSQDVYALMKCQFYDVGCTSASIFIVPTDNIYFHLHTGISWCSAILAIICVPIFLYKSYKIRKLGSLRMNDILLVSFLKKNVDYKQHKEIIDAFERKLDERRRALMDGTGPLQQASDACNTETVNLSVGICTPD